MRVYVEIARRDADLLARLNAAGFRTDFGEDGSGLLMKALRTGSGYYIDVGCSELIANGEVKVRSGVEIARFTEDGSRKITRIAEVVGLDEKEQFHTQDLFVSQLKGRGREGRLRADLEPTGTLPTFRREVHEHGLVAVEDLRVEGGLVDSDSGHGHGFLGTTDDRAAAS